MVRDSEGRELIREICEGKMYVYTYLGINSVYPVYPGGSGSL